MKGQFGSVAQLQSSPIRQPLTYSLSQAGKLFCCFQNPVGASVSCSTTYCKVICINVCFASNLFVKKNKQIYSKLLIREWKRWKLEERVLLPHRKTAFVDKDVIANKNLAQNQSFKAPVPFIWLNFENIYFKLPKLVWLPQYGRNLKAYLPIT